MINESHTPCAQCGAIDTTRAYYPALMGWFCVGDDGATCYDRKKQRESAPAASRG